MSKTYQGSSFNKIIINKDFARFIGLYLAEGCYTSRNVVFTFNNKEKDYIDFVKKYIQDVLGLNVSSFEYAEHNTTKVICSSVQLGRFLDSICGKYSDGKRIPDVMFYNTKELISEMLNAMVDGDGFTEIKSSNTYTHISTNSKIMALQSFLLYKKLGFGASIDIKKAHTGKDGVFHKETYLVNHYNPKRTNSRTVRQLQDKILIKIKYVHKYTAEKVVYNFTVANTHTYNIFGLHVSNCHRKGRSLIKFIQELQRYKLISTKYNAYELQNSIRIEFPDYYEQWHDNAPEKRIVNLDEWKKLTPRFYEYNHEVRKLNDDVIKDVRLHYNRETKQVIFPAYDYSGELMGYTEHFINGRLPKYSNKVDPRDLLYLEWLVRGKKIIVVEGMYDAIKIYQHLKVLKLLKEYSVVGTFGSEVSQGQIDKLVMLGDTLFLMGDNDRSGALMEKSIFRLASKKMPMIFRYDYTSHDPDKTTLKHFAKVIQNPLLYNAKIKLDLKYEY
jgi:5S rRNA maturation endonuclease (ribonuclease M5)